MCKRVGGKDTEEGDINREIIDEMYDDSWLPKLEIKDILLKYWKTTSDIFSSDHNIAYTILIQDVETLPMRSGREWVRGTSMK